MSENKNRKRKDVLVWCVVILPLLVFPLLLNWLLQINSPTKVIGNPETWLSFWSKYIGAVLTAIMVFASFITIRKTVNINKTNWKIDWLNNYRNVAAELLRATDSSRIGQVVQYVNFGKYDLAVEHGNSIALDMRRYLFLMDSILEEYDNVFETQDMGAGYSKQLKTFIEPILNKTGEIIQFALICVHLSEKQANNHFKEGIDAVKDMRDDMVSAGYSEIVDAIDKLQKNTFDDIVHDAIVKMQQSYTRDVDVVGLKDLLLKIGQKNAKKTYSYCFTVIKAENKEG